jgi:CO/xanthine dehydrogenase FAD-binding subunit
MSAAFTPGPWDCTGCQFPDDNLGGVYYRVQAEGMDAQGANARLIASAPELYEALERLAAQYARIATDVLGSSEEELKLHLKFVDAALRKARGEQS